ncbi:MAG: GTP cyclohydrolase I FolE [Firmicutes bacterium]|nr:GTP cyclohydrolase I FolE [Bacillota bacterium]
MLDGSCQKAYNNIDGGGEVDNKANNAIDQERIQKAVREILEAIGEDPEREGLRDTPQRIGRMYAEIFDGIHSDPRECLKTQFTEDEHNEMVIVRDIPFASMCEHHMLPFIGKAHVAYIPQNGRITGLSKIARVVQGYSHRLQLQERLTSQVADALMDELRPMGVLVIIEAEHMCMSIRGVNKPGALTVTSAVRGTFRSDQRTRSEALGLINSSRK